MSETEFKLEKPPIVEAVLAGYSAIQAVSKASSAVSHEAAAVRQSAGEVIQSVEQSVALFGKKAFAISQIWGLAKECSTQGWDGNDGNPVDPIAAAQAAEFIRALPDNIPLPEFAPEPDGSVSLDWMIARSRRFSLSVGGKNNRLAYAWLDGSNSGHGVDNFNRVTVPSRILHGICEIVGYVDSSFRAA